MANDFFFFLKKEEKNKKNDKKIQQYEKNVIHHSIQFSILLSQVR